MDLLSIWKQAEDWVSVIDHLLLVIGAISVAAIPSYFAHRNHKGIKAVQDQVQNAHTTNLRDDIDRAIAAVSALSQELRGLRQDVGVEQAHRRDQISDLRDYQRQVRSDIDRKFEELNATILEMKRKK
jgi:hypothetical protein